MAEKNKTVAVLLGGSSTERDVSKATGKSIYEALTTLGYNVKLIDPAYGLNQPKEVEKFFAKENCAEVSDRNYLTAINSELFDDVDVAFIALHGKWGEDGAIQNLLQLRGIKYTGSDALSSAVGMDKILTKVVLRYNNILTGNWLTVEANYSLDTILKAINSEIKYPCVVKPNDSGSTIGLSICKADGEIDEAIKLALKYSEKILIEEFIPGRELTVAVIDQKPLPVLEIKPKSGFYDYTSKYTSGLTEYFVPADITEELSNILKAEGLKTFNALGCKSYSRVDFRVTPENKCYVLEINTLPGMTSTSLVPKMARAEGIEFNELVNKILLNAVDEK